ncbi:TetR/AcrR family transcriptional regulator [Pseudonocardia sp. GCM10023141]|uniref:TetR/AcrR family transcriptional regulator n=1 Tax=Pseudonocardia sp. GCM10023141 TaxID=3252653 RepID=UPI00361EB708
MPRPIPAGRLASLIEAGTAVFVAQGYRRAQMQDVADALGVAKGTVYGAVAGKDALLLACIRYADGLAPLPEPEAWPLPAPTDGELVTVVAQRLGEVADLQLFRIAARPQPDPAVAEITSIVTDLMARLTRHRRAIKLVDRCAPEIDDLAQLWFGTGRARLVEQLRDYLVRRAEQGLLRPSPAFDVLARTVVETCVLWAVHRHWDPAPLPFHTTQPEDVITATLAELFAAALATDRDS